MKSDTEQWAVKDKTRLPLSIMEALAGDAHLSPEGDLHGFPVMAIPGASDAETPALKRNRLLFVLVCARLDDFEAPWALAVLLVRPLYVNLTYPALHVVAGHAACGRSNCFAK